MNCINEYINVLKEDTKNMNDLEKLRYIYIFLGKEFSFSTDFSFGNSKIKREIYNSCKYSEFELNKLFEKKIIICKSLCYIFEYVCNKLDLNVATSRELNQSQMCEHVFNYVRINDVVFTVDLQRDLENIQTHFKTEYFGLNQNQTINIIDDEILEELDYKIGYITESYRYTNDYIYMLKKAIENDCQVSIKMKLIIDNLNAYCDIKNISYIERSCYYQKIIKSTLSKKELNKINFIDCYKETDGNREYMQGIIISLPYNNNKIYLFNNEIKNFIDIDYGELKEYLDKGLVSIQNIPFQKKKTM